MDMERLLTQRVRGIDASGIRRVFDLGAKLKDPINLSIGQPDFDVPREVRQAAVEAIEGGHNGYTVTQGIAPLRERLAMHLREDLGWEVDTRPPRDADAGRPGVLVASGTSGALMLAMMALVEAGDEVIFADPYFVMYPHIVRMMGGTPVLCDTYPDFRLTAERVAPLITERTKAVLVNSPGNPTGAVLSGRECRELLDLCRSRGVLLISDEIYDEFTYSEAREDTGGTPVPPGKKRCPSPARFEGAAEDVLLVRGFGKTYGVTGWRLGYAAGPRRLIEEMAKLQQYTFVCAPSPLQHGAIAALDVDMNECVTAYQRRRDMVVERLGQVTEVAWPGGAFYAFVKVPDKLGLTGSAFVEQCIEKSVLVIPGSVFSSRDTHFRLSYATEERLLERGLQVLVELMR